MARHPDPQAALAEARSNPETALAEMEKLYGEIEQFGRDLKLRNVEGRRQLRKLF